MGWIHVVYNSIHDIQVKEQRIQVYTHNYRCLRDEIDCIYLVHRLITGKQANIHPI